MSIPNDALTLVVSMDPWWPTSRRLCLRFDIDTVEEIVECALVERDARCARLVHRWRPKCAAIQALVEEANSARICEQDLERVTASAEENEERAAPRWARHALCHDARQSIEAPPQIDRLDADEDLDTVRDHRVPPRAATISPSKARSNPDCSSMRTVPIAITIGALGDAAAVARALASTGLGTARRTRRTRTT
jgi:hypothetical protein